MFIQDSLYSVRLSQTAYRVRFVLLRPTLDSSLRLRIEVADT